MGWPEDRLDDPPRIYGAGRREELHVTYANGKVLGGGPLPDVPVLDPHPLVDEALEALTRAERMTLAAGIFDVGRDLVGEYVLARLEGRDAAAAVAAERSARRRDFLVLVFGTSYGDDLRR